ncbi:hypothetical protein AOA80_06350 [Methanomassiliicoccales archaeon RumEn M1]|nr:hypothetical protein AOA80_06350 [Methanomassiliicoccales archaeon RumEn M1]
MVLTTVEVLQGRGWDISEGAVQEGLSRAVWPGRLELARRSPDVILDGGHNPQCMEALARALRELYPGKKLILLTGVLADKDYPAMMGEILPLAKEFYTITPDSERAMPAAELAAYLESRGVKAAPAGASGRAWSWPWCFAPGGCGVRHRVAVYDRRGASPAGAVLSLKRKAEHLC